MIYQTIKIKFKIQLDSSYSSICVHHEELNFVEWGDKTVQIKFECITYVQK